MMLCLWCNRRKSGGRGRARMAAVSDQLGVNDVSPDPQRQATPMQTESHPAEPGTNGAAGINVCCVCQDTGDLLPCKVGLALSPGSCTSTRKLLWGCRDQCLLCLPGHRRSLALQVRPRPAAWLVYLYPQAPLGPGLCVSVDQIRCITDLSWKPLPLSRTICAHWGHVGVFLQSLTKLCRFSKEGRGQAHCWLCPIHSDAQ